MTKIIALSGAHGTGKSATLDLIKDHITPTHLSHLRVDSFKVSRTVLKALGKTLEEATATPESTMDYQTRVLKAAQRHNYLLNVQGAAWDQTYHLVDRSVADIYAYTRLWVEKNGIDPKWFENFENECVEMLSAYDTIYVFPIGKIPFVDDGVRAKEDTQSKIAEYIEYFIRTHAKNYHFIQAIAIDERANEILSTLQYGSNSTPTP